MRSISIIFFFLFINSVYSQSCTTTNLTYTYNGITQLDKPIDINNDSKSDLIVSSNQNTVYCYLQTTPNSFSTNIVNVIGNYAGSADFNNDGNVDLLSNQYFYSGLGTGLFNSVPLTNSLIAGAGYSEIRDFNNDGKKDVFSWWSLPYLYLGAGNGQFGSALSVSISGTPYVFDYLNSDLNVDIVTYDGAVKIYFGQANNTFTLASSFSVSAYVQNIKSTDLNGDGKKDLIISQNALPLTTYYGNGLGNFNLANSYNVLSKTIEIFDMNNDGLKDIVAINNSASNYTYNIIYNNGTSNLYVSPQTTVNLVNHQLSNNISLGDYNNDNLGDLAVGTWSGSAVDRHAFILSNPNCVWPGDANGNGVANNSDVLELGLQFNQTGSARTSTSNIWNGYSYTAWTGSVSTGKNKANADCNGDGVVNLNDTLAIYNNYGFMHNKSVDLESINEDITIVPDQSSVLKGNWGTASIYLGSSTNTISNIHGVAFTINFDNNIIETDSIWIEYTNSFINSNNLHFRKRDFPNSVLYTATTHTNQINASGNGKIAILHYKIKPSLSLNAVLNLNLISASKLSASGITSTLSAGSGTLNAVITGVGIKTNNKNTTVLIYPNPSNGKLTIKQLDSENISNKIEIYNSIGQLVFWSEINSSTETINTNLNKGIYYYSLSNIKGQTIKNKLIIE